MGEQKTTASSVNRAKTYQLVLFPLNNGATNVYYVLVLSYIATFGSKVLALSMLFASVMVTGMRLFDAVTDRFDPARHSLGITYNPGKVVRGMLADTAVKAATVDVVGYSSPANGGTSFSNEVILTFTGDSGAVKQAIIAARDVGMQVLKTLEPSVELKSTTTPYIL